MQPELPWNVAGIGPEAREAARASARREGLSVGEWLTRRILRGLAEASPAPSGERWWEEHVEPQPAVIPTRAAPYSAQDSADMLARISRSEGETQNSWRRIEEHLKTLGRRLEQTERSQTEHGRAMSQATTEMNIATREQAQVLDQIGTHVVGLGDRLSRLEQGSATEGFKDAVKALHQGLSRLADQLSETATHSAEQASQLAASIETVAGKLAESRDETQLSRQALEDRIAMLAANVSSLAGKLLETRDENDRKADVLEARVSASEHAIESLKDISATVETLSQRLSASEARISASEHTIEQLESDTTSTTKFEPEMRRQAATLKDVTTAVDSLGQRVATNEAKQATGIAKIDVAVGGRLLALEQKISDVTEKLEQGDHNKADIGGVEADVQSMGVRLDGLENQLKTAIAELETLAREATAKHDAVRAETAVPHFDLPPFTDHDRAEPPFAAHEPEPLPASHIDAAPSGPDLRAAASAAANPFATAEPSEHLAGVESFLAAARRNARAAAEPDQEQRKSLFSWGEPAAAAAESDERGKTRVVLLAGLGVLIVAALVAGIVLSRTFSDSTLPQPAPVRPQVTQSAPPKPSTPAAHPATPTSTAQTNSPQTNTSSAPPSPAVNPVPEAQSNPDTEANSETAPPPAHGTHHARTAASSRFTPPARTNPAPAQVTPIRTQAAPATRLAGLANSGNAKAEELLGLEYLDGDGMPVNEAQGAKWLERAALQGEPVAAYRLGTLYERGQGVSADPAKAVQWYSTAAKAGNRKAMHNLAVAYAQGTGTQKDLASAAQWFTRAAALGLADSEFNLAVLYERGMGVPQSLTNAYKWYAIAAAQGDVESKTRLEALDSQISADDKASAVKAAAEFQPGRLDRIANSPPDAAAILGG
ncbi:MAG TPA: hypothetical protein VGK90_09795 [Rhizomicrobium sp.]|jgi:localization factor PodJL